MNFSLWSYALLENFECKYYKQYIQNDFVNFSFSQLLHVFIDKKIKLFQQKHLIQILRRLIAINTPLKEVECQPDVYRYIICL